jgi:hypothetical protein
MKGTYSVSLPRRDAYEVKVEGLSYVPFPRVVTFSQLEERDFEWDIIAMD